jgi:hypothetical protein
MRTLLNVPKRNGDLFRVMALWQQLHPHSLTPLQIGLVGISLLLVSLIGLNVYLSSKQRRAITKERCRMPLCPLCRPSLSNLSSREEMEMGGRMSSRESVAWPPTPTPTERRFADVELTRCHSSNTSKSSSQDSTDSLRRRGGQLPKSARGES